MNTSRFAGIVPAETVLQRTAEGSEYSDKANDLNQGFDQVTPRDFGGAGAIMTGLPTDIQGPSGFNLPNAAAQNVVTDVNAAGLKGKGSPSFGSFPEQTDLHQKVSLGNPKMDSDGLGSSDAPEDC